MGIIEPWEATDDTNRETAIEGASYPAMPSPPHIEKVCGSLKFKVGR